MKVTKIFAVALMVMTALGAKSALAAPDITVRSVPFDTEQAGDSLPSLSADGRYILYKSQQWGPGGTTLPSYFYIHDLQTGERTTASKKLDGAAEGSECRGASFSGNGRYVGLSCVSTSMGAKTVGGLGIFVYDKFNDTTEMVPDTGRDGVNSIPGISADGGIIAFSTIQNTTYRLYVRDMVNKSTAPTAAEFSSGGQRRIVSADGRFVSYVSGAVPNYSAYVYDRITGVTEAVNVRADNKLATMTVGELTMSADGNVFAFISTPMYVTGLSTESKLYSVYVRDRKAGKTELVSGLSIGNALFSGISGNGRYVSYFRNNTIYVYDRLTKITREIAPPGLTAFSGPKMNYDGRFVVFHCRAPQNVHYLCVADMGIAAGVTLSQDALKLTEGGDAGTYTLALTQAPEADVKITVGPGSKLGVARSELVFTPQNWNVPQVVSVRALANGVAEGIHTAKIVHTITTSDANYSVVQPADVTVTITDGVAPTIHVPGSPWTLSDMPVTGTAAPGATVILSAYNRTTGWMSGVSTVADAQGKWSYTLTGFTDGVIELDAVADGLKSPVQTVTVKLATTTTPPTQPTYIDVTGNIRTTAYGLILNRSTGKYAGDFVLTNTGSINLKGPLHLQFNELTSGVTLFNATGNHDGSPYITVDIDLVPDASVTIPLLFVNPEKVTVNYDARIYSGRF
ncbi:TolB family protein [Duganella phyllosphaerae]|uniref:Protein TolB n=1 Tax=Duganella phyllosphaerae TaxID=762836 RepID=A0A1E7WKQ2_9BURK|nr:hypothetical protein [Duganella phyllosphaerae]OEZ99564.1 hypothetical protein DUPY_26080 [Duganella phyllosphaerae]